MTLVSQRAFKSSRRNSDARPTYCGCGVLAGSSGLSAILRSSINVLPFCMKAGRDQSVLQLSSPEYNAHGCDTCPVTLLKL